MVNDCFYVVSFYRNRKKINSFVLSTLEQVRTVSACASPDVIVNVTLKKKRTFTWLIYKCGWF